MSYRDVLDLVILSAVWGASFLFMRVATPEFGAIALIELRVSIALAFLLPFFLARTRIAELRSRWKPLAAIGALNSALPFCLLSWATLTLTGGFVSIVNSTTPLFGALVAWLWLGERLLGRQVLGLLIGFAGVFVLLREPAGAGAAAAWPAVLAAVSASLLYGLGANLTRRYLGDVSPLTIATGSMITASLVLLPGAVLTWPDAPVSPEGWLSVAIMGVASTGVAYLLFFRLLSRVGPARALTVTYLVPVFAMVWGVLFIGEHVTASMLGGCAVILAGITLASGVPLGRMAGARRP